MLPQWLKSPSRVHSTPPSTPRSSRRNFSCSSFKDIQSLLVEESEPERVPEPGSPQLTKKPSVFHRVRISASVLRTWSHRNAILSSQPSITIPNGDQRIIIYFTSLRVVRKTYEDCRSVRSILRGFRVPLDERDVSMDAKFLDELQGIIGRKNLSLPRVFIGGKYIGGAEEILRLHESGELNRMIGRFPAVKPSHCDICGGMRFVLCEQCNGSHKIYLDKLGFRGCTTCNTNGLIRCPSCCPPLL